MEYIQSLLGGSQMSMIVSIAVFLSTATLVLGLAALVTPLLDTRRRLNQELAAAGYGDRRALAAQAEIRRSKTLRPVDAYFRATQKAERQPDALERRLFEAGFYSGRAVLFYNLARVAFVGIAFIIIFPLASMLLGQQVPVVLIFAGSAVFSTAFMIFPSFALDAYASNIKEQYRRGFPDFMDMMITCADAGMSLEAAVDRVSTEFAATHKHLGVQLTILTLQLRAGKPLRDALRELGDRVALDEARSLAVLFRQSEELGTSLIDALRVYADEMRTQRILRAEEKANALPVKMVIPLGLCVFPVVMAIVMIPVVLRMKGVFF